MSKQINALKLALEALEDAQYFIEAELNDRMDLYKNYTNLAHKYAGEQESLRKNQESITAIKEALAQPEHHTLTSRVNDVRFHKERDEQRDEAMKMLSQPEQEPVAYIHRNEYNEYRLEPHDNFDIRTIPFNVDVPLFKAPQRKPLTGDALLSAAQSCLSPSQYDHFEALIENDQDAHNRLARAIENERGK